MVKKISWPLLAILGVALLVCALIILSPATTSATGDALWGPDADKPTVKVISTNYQPTQEEKYNCHDHDFVIRQSNDLDHPFDPVFEDQTYTKCAFYTTFGLTSASADSFMQLNDSAQPYKVYDNINIENVPNEHSLFVRYGEDGLAAYDNPQNDFTIMGGADYNSVTYPHMYKFKDGVQPRVLKDSDGHIIFNLLHMGVSVNAKWFVFQRYKQFIRVDANDFNNMLTFPADPAAYDYWGDPVSNGLAVTNDGRYIVVGGANGADFTLYDLSSCEADPSYNMNNATSCGEVNMLSFLQQQLSLPIVQISYPHFSSDGTQLSLNVAVNDNGTRRNELVDLIAPGGSYNPSPQDSSYIALGDSFASGEGAFNYYTGTDESDNKCHLSKQSYPYLLGLQLQLGSFNSVACSGAKMINVNGPDASAQQYTTKPSDAFSDYWIPGYEPQIQYINDKQPNIVTISMVGNDVGFSSIIKSCIALGSCFSTYEDRMGLVENINSKFDNLVAMYTQIQAAAASGAKVYVIGYPQIVEPDGDCALNVHLNKTETEFASELVDYLDQVIRQAAEAAGVGYVNTQDAFDGHRMCEAGTKAVNGLTAGNDTLDIIGDESYHPDSLGHQLLAVDIKAQTDNFDEAMPAPDWSVESPEMSYAVNLLNAPKANGPISKTEFDDHSPLTPLLHEDTVSGNLSGSEYHFDPGANYDVSMHSTPIDLGTITADDAGNLSYSFMIPEDIESGWHTVDVTGDDITGTPVDIQRLVYVAVSADDWDGDGVPNDQEPCGLIPASGVDSDKDGIDDACDGQITKPPVPAAPTVSVTSPINLASQKNATISGQGEPGTTANISIDDTDPDTPAVTATAILPTATTKTVAFTKALDVSSLDDGKLTVSVTLSDDYGTSPAATTTTTKDTRPPVVTANQNPAANSAGWNNYAVTLQLSASDTGTGVKNISYSVSGAQSASQTVSAASTSVNISSEGKMVLTFAASDRAGNTSDTETRIIKIDTKGPVTNIEHSWLPILLGGFDGSLKGRATDNLSGVASTTVTFTNFWPHRQIVRKAKCLSDCGGTKISWRVSTEHLPSGLYTVTAGSVDQASNIGAITPKQRVVIFNFPEFLSGNRSPRFSGRWY